jgi:hypothetical protein
MVCAKLLSQNEESISPFLSDENDGYQFLWLIDWEQNSIFAKQPKFSLSNWIRTKGLQVFGIGQWVKFKTVQACLQQLAAGLFAKPPKVLHGGFFNLDGPCHGFELSRWPEKWSSWRTDYAHGWRGGPTDEKLDLGGWARLAAYPWDCHAIRGDNSVSVRTELRLVPADGANAALVFSSSCDHSYNPGMTIVLAVTGVAFAAFFLWLAVRIVNRRELWAKRSAVVLLVVALVGYPLSFGAACWWASGHPDEDGIITVPAPFLYWPFGWAKRRFPEIISRAIGRLATLRGESLAIPVTADGEVLTLCSPRR